MTKTGSTLILMKTFSNKLDQGSLDILRHMAVRRQYPPNSVLCHQGEIEHTFYVVVDGRVASVQKLEDGEERLLGMLGPNEYFGEMALIDDSPRMATCVTLLPTIVLEITEEVFDDLVERNPAIAYHITRRIVETARNMDRLAIIDLRKKNEALEKAYAELQAAQAKIVEKERLEREIELAADVQRNLLPGSLPQYPGYEFVAYLEPARQVGGDFYDVIQIDDDHVGLLIADVADKGFHAAMFMAVTRTLFHQEGRHALSPAKVTMAVHKGMLAIATNSDVFVTAFYAVLHRPSGRLTYVRAGHDRPLLLRKDQVTSLPGKGRFLGMLEDLNLEEYILQLQAGDRLIMFSDGVPDAVNEMDEHFGNGRLAATLESGKHLDTSSLSHHIVADINRWAGNAPAFDDLTLLIMGVKEF